MIVERLSGNHLHDDEMGAVDRVDVVDRDDVGMIERRGSASLSNEPGAAVLVGHGLRRQELHCYHAPEPDVGGRIHNPHPALPELCGHGVVREGASRSIRAPRGRD